MIITDDSISKRKKEHLDISIRQDVQSNLSNGLETIQFVHNALPEIDFNDIDTCGTLLGKNIEIPLLISSMTGGAKETIAINQRLAEVAQSKKIAFAVGSQRAAIENPDLMDTFNVRRWAKDVPVFANLGAVQLNYGFSIDQCIKAIDMIEADALILHLNPLQEAFQPEGNVNFKNLLPKIENICKKISTPLIIKEVGWGISYDVARRLGDVGVSIIDVAGAGGTSWAKIEMKRSNNKKTKELASPFLSWGIPTVSAIKMVKAANSKLKIIASGGVKDGVDIAKCLALGADICGMAGILIKESYKSKEDLIDFIDIIHEQLKICMFSIGAESIDNITSDKIIEL